MYYMSCPDRKVFIDNIFASSNLFPSFFLVSEALLLAERTELEVPVPDLFIKDAFNSEEAMKQRFLRLPFSQSLITRLMDHEGLTSARELTIIHPSDLSDIWQQQPIKKF